MRSHGGQCTRKSTAGAGRTAQAEHRSSVHENSGSVLSMARKKGIKIKGSPKRNNKRRLEWEQEQEQGGQEVTEKETDHF